MAEEQHSAESGDAKAGGTSRRSALKAAVAGAAAVTAMGAAAPIAHADGPGRGAPTFVLVHGSRSNSFYWQPLLRELGLRGHRAIAVDLPGHGLGAYLPESYQSPQDLERLRTWSSRKYCTYRSGVNVLSMTAGWSVRLAKVCGVPGATTTSVPVVASQSSPPTVNRTVPERM